MHTAHTSVHPFLIVPLLSEAPRGTTMTASFHGLPFAEPSDNWPRIGYIFRGVCHPAPTATSFAESLIPNPKRIMSSGPYGHSTSSLVTASPTGTEPLSREPSHGGKHSICCSIIVSIHLALTFVVIIGCRHMLPVRMNATRTDVAESPGSLTRPSLAASCPCPGLMLDQSLLHGLNVGLGGLPERIKVPGCTGSPCRAAMAYDTHTTEWHREFAAASES
ncbi:uncharacterized protein B0H18DRAFT_40481 [Fomitopsis serialis]|uniref:uncharacterized protein n=1 Tax=Fomitopsis serialis TaxID=139415 RepID=UPI002007A808|nr:uncharacterized protein B0H18DRAFT_40481 [Neoantrodia serialis]KAH9917250.1 hypothetical protein B0H18DRAFT_40481 [Neoantrodia serialis]